MNAPGKLTWNLKITGIEKGRSSSKPSCLCVSTCNCKPFGCFQKYGQTPQIIHLFIGFSLINHPFWGTIIFGSTPICKHGNAIALSHTSVQGFSCKASVSWLKVADCLGVWYSRWAPITSYKWRDMGPLKVGWFFPQLPTHFFIFGQL